ncbi:hypothetical protein [Nostoc sp.]|uniref:hypothetical protein n=1 Tax=Nostoc sp. TaxID=1180 RepID=UPI002FFBCBD6
MIIPIYSICLISLGNWIPELPNWFRFRMLEIIGSQELEYYQFNAETGLKEKKIFSGGIKYGMAFNAVYKAIYTVYETMASVVPLTLNT